MNFREQFPGRRNIEKQNVPSASSNQTEAFRVFDTTESAPRESMSGIPEAIISEIFRNDPRFGENSRTLQMYRAYIEHRALTDQLVSDPDQDGLIFPDQYADNPQVMGDDADLTRFIQYVDQHYS